MRIGMLPAILAALLIVADIDLPVLEQLIAASVAKVKWRYG